METGRFIIYGRLIDGVAEQATENGMVVVEDGRIAYAGEEKSWEREGQYQVIDVKGKTILPGFIDCHTHISGTEKSKEEYQNHFDCILTAARDMGLLLDAGFTLIRDMTLFSGALSKAVAQGELRGPDIIPGGRVMSPTAGHCDVTSGVPTSMVNAHSIISYVADGKEGCLKGAREQFRGGAKFLKICATGGISSEVDAMTDIQFSDEEITAIVEEAKRHNTYVAAHCCNAAGTLQALRCGVACVEHGDELDEECIRFMSEHDIPVITTLYVTMLSTEAPDYPSYMTEKAFGSLAKNLASIRRAFEAGITVGFGTDFGNSQYTPYLRNGLEFRAITKAGFTPMEAIKVGTSLAAKAVRCEDTRGSLEAGKRADIVIVDGDPLEDIEVLTSAEHVKMVLKQGELVKNTLRQEL